MRYASDASCNALTALLWNRRSCLKSYIDSRIIESDLLVSRLDDINTTKRQAAYHRNFLHEALEWQFTDQQLG